jgi:hypothetical protein
VVALDLLAALRDERFARRFAEVLMAVVVAPCDQQRQLAIVRLAAEPLAARERPGYAQLIEFEREQILGGVHVRRGVVEAERRAASVTCARGPRMPLTARRSRAPLARDGFEMARRFEQHVAVPAVVRERGDRAGLESGA